MLSLMFLVLAGEPVLLDGISAVVGTVPVLHSDVLSFLTESGVEPAAARGMGPGDVLYDAALSELVDEKLLVEAARRSGLYPTSAEVGRSVEQFLDQRRGEFSGEAAFHQALAASGLTLAAYRELLQTTLAHRMAAENYVRTLGGSAGVFTSSDPAEYLLENTEALREHMGLVNLEWIYMPVLPGATAEAESLLASIRGRVESGLADFASMAMEYSQDATARTGGDLSWFGPGDMTPAFETRVAALSPGEITGPFVTPFGVHLVMLTDRSGDSLRASHILRLVPLEEADRERVENRAVALRDSLTAGGLSFSDAAARYSLDPETRRRGGSLGSVFLNAWDESLSGPLGMLSPGEISAPLPLERGGALALFRLSEDQTPDFSGYSRENLESAVSSFIWQSSLRRTLDSLRAEIPVFYPGDE